MHCSEDYRAIMYEGKQIMKTALGSRSYDRMIDALQQDTYDESNYSILAKILNLEEYFNPFLAGLQK